MKLKYLVLLLTLPLGVVAYGQSVSTPFGTGGSTSYIPSGGSGGGSGANAVTNAPNFFTAASTNTFKVINFSDAGKINLASGGTFARFNGANDWVVTFPASGRTMFDIAGDWYTDDGTGFAALRVYQRVLRDSSNGDIVDWGTGLSLGVNSSTAITIRGKSLAIPNAVDFGSGVLQLPPSTSGNTTNGSATFITTGNAQIGLNSASILTIPGKTVTATSGLDINSGVFSVGATTAVTTTNGGSLYIGGSSLTMATPADLWERRSANAGVTNSLNDGYGTVVQQNTYRFANRTNDLNGLTWAANLKTTNNAQRAYVSFAVSMPAAARVVLYTDDQAGNVLPSAPIVNNTAAITTNWIGGFLQPNQVFWPSNMIGTSTIDPNLSKLSSF